uniref:Uncharacterized protein n=1 Tax=viral metagenome TaxID=1070528 RepID=A0A6C0EGK9_9ZZZZ
MEKSNANIYGSQSGHASTRKILRDVWNSKNVVGQNESNRKIGSFRAVMNAGDLLSRPNYSCGGPNPLQSLAFRFNSLTRRDNTRNNCDNSGVPPSSCNVKYVYDSSLFTRFKKESAYNRVYKK